MHPKLSAAAIAAFAWIALAAPAAQHDWHIGGIQAYTYMDTSTIDIHVWDPNSPTKDGGDFRRCEKKWYTKSSINDLWVSKMAPDSAWHVNA